MHHLQEPIPTIETSTPRPIFQATLGGSQARGVLIGSGNHDLHIENQQDEEEIDEILSVPRA